MHRELEFREDHLEVDGLSGSLDFESNAGLEVEESREHFDLTADGIAPRRSAGGVESMFDVASIAGRESSLDHGVEQDVPPGIVRIGCPRGRMIGFLGRGHDP